MIWLLFVCCFVFLFFFPRTFFNGFALPQILALGTLSSLGLVWGVANGLVLLATPVFLILIFLFYILFSVTWSFPLHNAKKELGLQLPLIILFLLASTYLTFGGTEIICLGITLASFLCCIYAHVQTFGIDPFFPNDIKRGGVVTNAIGSIGNPNYLSAYLAGVIWLGFYSALTISPYLVFMPLYAIYVLYKTNSRGGQVGFVSSVLFGIVVFLYFCDSVLSQNLFKILILCICLGIAFIIYLFKKIMF